MPVLYLMLFILDIYLCMYLFHFILKSDTF